METERKLIDEKELRQYIYEKIPLKLFVGRFETANDRMLQLLKVIHEFPSIKVKPETTGHWDEVDMHFGAISGRCSSCRKYAGLWLVNDPYRYCPYCGEKNEVSKDDMDKP